MIEIRKLTSPEAIAEEAAHYAADVLAKAQEKHNLATFVLAGGRLPPVAYGILASKYANIVDWTRLLFFIGDERCVPLDDPDSSWLTALPMFDAHPEVPGQHKLRPPSNLPAEEAAEAYAKELGKLAPHRSGAPILDHLWLGIGEDGHTLSLFPGHPSSADTDKLVIPVHNSPKPPPDRISLTYKALEGVESAVVFVSGASKAPILAQIAGGDYTLPVVIASQTIANAGGRVIWLVDDEAMSLVPGGSLSI